MALFSDLSSAPSSMEAAKAVDAYGLFPGNVVKQADACQAYIQSDLGGTPSYVRLPRERQPAAWKSMRDPVCRLRKALYGHPDAGGYWEEHCEKHLRKCGFAAVPDWCSVYWNDKLKVLLAVYVDDFKMAGPTAKVEEAWRLIRDAIKTDEPADAGKYLGCDHIQKDIWIAPGSDPMAQDKVPAASKTKLVRTLEYNMEMFLVQCVERYTELAGKSGANLQKVSTPFVEDLATGPDYTEKSGILKPIASKVLMKILYAARMCRYDLLRATCALASLVTKWTPSCDKKLHRLVSYIHSTLALRLVAWVGDHPKDIAVKLFSDADFAGDQQTSRSTSGASCS